MIEAVTAFAGIARIRHMQAEEEAAEKEQSEARRAGGDDIAPGEAACE